jgi:hypothetical protein
LNRKYLIDVAKKFLIFSTTFIFSRKLVFGFILLMVHNCIWSLLAYFDLNLLQGGFFYLGNLAAYPVFIQNLYEGFTIFYSIWEIFGCLLFNHFYGLENSWICHCRKSVPRPTMAAVFLKLKINKKLWNYLKSFFFIMSYGIYEIMYRKCVIY